jgi:hypothetical protein
MRINLKAIKCEIPEGFSLVQRPSSDDPKVVKPGFNFVKQSNEKNLFRVK